MPGRHLPGQVDGVGGHGAVQRHLRPGRDDAGQGVLRRGGRGPGVRGGGHQGAGLQAGGVQGGVEQVDGVVRVRQDVRRGSHQPRQVKIFLALQSG